MRYDQLKQQIPTLGEEAGTLLAASTAGEQAAISLIEFGPDACHETVFSSLEEGMAYQPQLPVLWLNVYGLADPAVMRGIGERFGLHPLVLEDVMNARQRPKLEDYGDYLFLVTRVFSYQGEGEQRLTSDQVYLIIGRGYVISFQTRRLGVFSSIRDRLHNGRGQLRHRGADYLAYSLIDAVIDDYFGVLDQFSQRVEQVDVQLLSGRGQQPLRRIHRLKHDTTKLRRALVPLRDVLSMLVRGDQGFFGTDTLVYLRDAYDHAQALMESLEASRDTISSMLDLYLSTQSNRLNEQMRVLTVITLIFMPLTLIAGIYGMNFQNMPELHWEYGYYLVLAVMGVIGGGLGYLFWRWRWL